MPMKAIADNGQQSLFDGIDGYRVIESENSRHRKLALSKQKEQRLERPAHGDNVILSDGSIVTFLRWTKTDRLAWRLNKNGKELTGIVKRLKEDDPGMIVNLERGHKVTTSSGVTVSISGRKGKDSLGNPRYTVIFPDGTKSHAAWSVPEMCRARAEVF